MKKPLIIAITVWLFAVSAGAFYFWNTPQKSSNNLASYKNLWQETFRSYQSGVTKIPKKGKFDFEMASMATGSGEALTRLWNMEFREKFSSLAIAILGDYDFESAEHPSLDATMKMYLNKRSFGAGDIDIGVHIDGNGMVAYTLNNLKRNALEFLGVPPDMIDSLMLSFDENKGKMITSGTEAELLRGVIAAITEASKDSPLKENSKEEEQKIIAAFLDDEVIEVTSGEQKDEDITTLTFRLNPDNTIRFLNNVATILGGDNTEKRFDGDVEFFKSFTIAGTMDIQDARVIDSHILTEIPVSSLDPATLEKRYDLLKLENQLIYPNPERFDIDLTSLISSQSTPDNKLQFHFRWLIK
ncbi:MAG: hypothetical protein ACD_78C00072G0002 [uncultured bacterium (gcode 4)]|uniref:Uncharacterized protein n=1 Tax=uncultured bacterium (gcode 4) TaxID=1234023 RepID=K1YDP7_9BACT|nr:MAG: hypothetical protein ACD_78C00072G0002 [uncultured bacterium (gcode 4)]